MREYTSFATSEDRAVLSILADDQTPPSEYRAALSKLGASLADMSGLYIGVLIGNIAAGILAWQLYRHGLRHLQPAK